jgi:hypothetical protein
VQSDYEVVTAQLRGIEEGEMLLMTKFLSLDPYMRSEFMNLERSLGKKIIGGTVSEVVESKCRGWEIGDLVVGAYGWTEFAIGKASDMQSRGLPIQKWDRTLGAPSLGIGALGMTGFTAFHGLLNKTNPMKGETVVVSSASGAVGQVVAQLAKIRGCKVCCQGLHFTFCFLKAFVHQVVGIAGGPAKCAFCVDELGVDACIDYKDAANFRANLAAAVPGGIGPCVCYLNRPTHTLTDTTHTFLWCCLSQTFISKTSEGKSSKLFSHYSTPGAECLFVASFRSTMSMDLPRKRSVHIMKASCPARQHCAMFHYRVALIALIATMTQY